MIRGINQVTLIKCPECAGKVSTEAPACPSCGYPVNPANAEPAFHRFVKRIFVGLLILCFFAFPFALAGQKLGASLLALLGIIVAAVKLAGMSSREA